MTIRSRLWASLAVALAMVLAAGLASAEPAAAGPDEADLAAAEAAELGAVLDVQYESQPDGFIRTTEYENATVTEIQVASCRITTTANRPTKSGSRVRGSGSFKLSSGCSGTWEVLLNIKVLVGTDYVIRGGLRRLVYPPYPYSAYVSTSAPCDKGRWISEIVVQKGSEDQSSRSSSVVFNRC